MSANVTIFIHDHDDGPARIADIFDDLGFNQTHIFTPADDLGTFDPLAPDVLVVMGGAMGVYEADQHRYLKTEIELLKTRLAADKPTLGICLGAQLMAAALGSTVHKGVQGFEYGWLPVQVNAAGMNMSVKHLDGTHARMFHWHQDTFDLPKEAVLLASSALYPHQIFSHGKNALAIQFHPEVVEEQVDLWAEGLQDETVKTSMIDGAPIYMPGMDRQFRAFMTDWLKETGIL